MQKKTKRNFKTVALSLLLVAAMVVTGISAYFTATDTKTNVFTVGKISIDLQEPSWNGDVPTTPNETVPKDPQILNDGNADAYVYLTVEVPYANVEVADANGNVSEAADTELFSYTTNAGWVEVGAPVKDEAKGVYKHVYAYAADADTLTVLSPEATTAKLFNEVKFANVVETPDDDSALKDLLEGEDLDIVINAYGIETEIIGGEATPEYVWTVITNQVINGNTSEKPVLLEGDGSTYNLFAVNDLRFRSSAPMDEFQEVQVNGQTVDPQYYTVSEGSTVINLSGEYLATLNADEHDIAIVSDAGAAEGTFSATEGIPEGCTYTVKATGEVLTGGDPLPAVPAEGDIYTTSDYEFHYWEVYDGTRWSSAEDLGMSKEVLVNTIGQEGPWFCATTDKTKEAYEKIPTVIFGEEIKGLVKCFANCTNMKVAPRIPSSVSSITNAFENSGLVSISVPSHIPTAQYAFKNCSNLQSAVINSNKVCNSMFENCTALSLVEFSSNVETISPNAFANCTGLTSIIIPDSVTSIDSIAFKNCTNLTIYYSGVATGTPWGAAQHATEYIEDGVIYSDPTKTVLKGVSDTQITSFVIPDSVSSIGKQAFYQCRNLTSISIPDKVTSIGDSAFASCTGLTSINLGNGVNYIGKYAFQDCSRLTSITIPDSVTNIDNCAFYTCMGLTSVDLGDGLETIGSYVFQYTSLTEIKIPDSAINIDSNALSNCSNLTTIYYSGTATGAPWGATNATVVAE